MDRCDTAFDGQRYVITAFEGLGGHMISLKDVWREAWNTCISECRKEVLSVGEDASEAAKAKDARTYQDGYQDSAVDCDEALRDLISNANVTGLAPRKDEK